MPTKLIIDYSEGTFCCHASWIYGTHVRKVPMEEPVECDYDNYDTIYIVIDTTTDKSYHFKNKYQASEYMDENSYMWCAQFKSAFRTFELSQPSLVGYMTNSKCCLSPTQMLSYY